MTSLSFEAQKQQAIDTQSDRANEFADSYARLRNDPYQNCFYYSRHRLDEFLRRYLPENGSGKALLDVGCGTGHHMAALRERGYAVSGVDASPEMLALARANNPTTEIHEADVEALPFDNARFDLVICIEVLRHLPRSSTCIQEMARVLKPGGICLATAAPVFNLNGYSMINRLASSIRVGNLARHKQAFHTSRRLRREFGDAGFANPSIHGVYLGPINWVERLFPWTIRPTLRIWEPFDRLVADRPLMREFSNMFLIHAVCSR